MLTEHFKWNNWFIEKLQQFWFLTTFTDFYHFSLVNHSCQKCWYGNKERSILNFSISEFYWYIVGKIDQVSI